jgi:hypothetical protein
VSAAGVEAVGNSNGLLSDLVRDLLLPATLALLRVLFGGGGASSLIRCEPLRGGGGGGESLPLLPFAGGSGRPRSRVLRGRGGGCVAAPRDDIATFIP